MLLANILTLTLKKIHPLSSILLYTYVGLGVKMFHIAFSIAIHVRNTKDNNDHLNMSFATLLLAFFF